MRKSYWRVGMLYAIKLIFGSCVLVLVTIQAQAGLLNVPGGYPSIQAAIDAARDGDTVRVAPGTYRENLIWHLKSIVLIGAGADATIVDGGGIGSCLGMLEVPDTAKVEGFTFTGGSGWDGGGLWLRFSHATLSNNIIRSNMASEFGGGLYLNASSPTVMNNTITGNTAKWGAGGYSAGMDRSPQ